MTARLEILKRSLAKKQFEFDCKLQSHMDDVRSANGQPLNDKRNGATTIHRWDRQNESLRTLTASIEKTKAAIDREESKIASAASVDIPAPLQKLIDEGKVTQWRKHPHFFFVVGVDRARIILLDNGTVAHRYVQEIATQEQYAIFRDLYNALRKELLK